ncbi:hypothetical protein GCM10010260_27330 [Streptomyces filipinensis]|uniref:Uncharacterized protein n=1 Tax=Streptomyces filipinensis TaxID=66887 RepID=A0A918IAI7_9ACTN|nr:hypothetical protein GCM10010260_27330 [Streptomyces filipinensis]
MPPRYVGAISGPVPGSGGDLRRGRRRRVAGQGSALGTDGVGALVVTGGGLTRAAQFMVPVAGDDRSPPEALLAVAGDGQVGVGRQKGAAVDSVCHAVSGSSKVADGRKGKRARESVGSW